MIVSQNNNAQTVNTETYDKSKMKVDNNHGALTQNDFLDLFIKQMQSQDPTKPMDSSEMMQQTATFTQVQSMKEMNDSLKAMADSAAKSGATAQLSSASYFIGKVMEYDGNDATLSQGGAPISFEASSIPSKTTVTVRDATGKFVTSFTPQVTDTGRQYLVWDGKDINGNKMPLGKYKFNVTATDANAKPVEVRTLSNGPVTGVSTQDGSLMYEVGGKISVSPDKVVSIRDADNV